MSKPKKLCRFCEESTIHETGSQLWVSCPKVKGWRGINSECVLPQETKEAC